MAYRSAEHGLTSDAKQPGVIPTLCPTLPLILRLKTKPPLIEETTSSDDLVELTGTLMCQSCQYNEQKACHFSSRPSKKRMLFCSRYSNKGYESDDTTGCFEGCVVLTVSNSLDVLVQYAYAD